MLAALDPAVAYVEIHRRQAVPGRWVWDVTGFDQADLEVGTATFPLERRDWAETFSRQLLRLGGRAVRLRREG